MNAHSIYNTQGKVVKRTACPPACWPAAPRRTRSQRTGLARSIGYYRRNQACMRYDHHLANGTMACASCHEQSRAFSDGKATPHGSTRQRNTVFVEAPFHNTGLYNLDGRGAYPANNPGHAGVSNRPEDMGRFRAPSLRNVALTAYMHDGSVATVASSPFSSRQ